MRAEYAASWLKHAILAIEDVFPTVRVEVHRIWHHTELQDGECLVAAHILTTRKGPGVEVHRLEISPSGDRTFVAKLRSHTSQASGDGFVVRPDSVEEIQDFGQLAGWLSWVYSVLPPRTNSLENHYTTPMPHVSKLCWTFGWEHTPEGIDDDHRLWVMTPSLAKAFGFDVVILRPGRTRPEECRGVLIQDRRPLSAEKQIKLARQIEDIARRMLDEAGLYEDDDILAVFR